MVAFRQAGRESAWSSRQAVSFPPIMRISTAGPSARLETDRFAFQPTDWISFILLIYGTVKYWQLLAAPSNQGYGQPEIVSVIASGATPVDRS
jgi:hypothetical protein